MPDLVIDTDSWATDECVEQLLEYVGTYLVMMWLPEAARYHLSTIR